MLLQGSGETGCAERGSFWAFEVSKLSKIWVWTLSLKIFSWIQCFIELQPCRHLICRLSRREEQLGLSKQSIHLEVMVLFPVLTSRLVAAQRVAFLDSLLYSHLSLVWKVSIWFEVPTQNSSGTTSCFDHLLQASLWFRYLCAWEADWTVWSWDQREFRNSAQQGPTATGLWHWRDFRRKSHKTKCHERQGWTNGAFHNTNWWVKLCFFSFQFLGKALGFWEQLNHLKHLLEAFRCRPWMALERVSSFHPRGKAKWQVKKWMDALVWSKPLVLKKAWHFPRWIWQL